MKLADKVAIITGAGGGIGRAYALRFGEEGAKVVIADIVRENVQRVAGELEERGVEALAVHVDIADEPSTLKMAEETLARFGRIDILVNNAALYGGFGVKAWDAWTIEDWRRSFDINVVGSWRCIKAVVPHMISRGKGKIINIGSSTFDLGIYQLLPYTCSKAAIVALTRSLARALGRHGINVNCISPGFTLSDASLKMTGENNPYNERVKAGRSLRRDEQPEDLVGTAVFLASADSDFLTGQTIRVHGGETAV